MIAEEKREWLEADGCGGFASGTDVPGLRTRCYHALLLAATTPPTGRSVLVNGFEAHVITPRGRFALTTQHYAPEVFHPDGQGRVSEFVVDPWPRWSFTLEDGTRLEHELFAVHGEARVVLRFRLLEPRPGVTLELRPLMSGRDYHALHHENPAFEFAVAREGDAFSMQPYVGLPGVTFAANADFEHAPDWYRNFCYAHERARGLGFSEDLASPGVLRFDLSQRTAAWYSVSAEGLASPRPQGLPAGAWAEQLATRERTRRARFASPLERAADTYLVRRGGGLSIVAGYPWFTDWGRDTFIAVRGLCIAAGRLAEARSILLEWSSAVSRGMLPNRFADHADMPEAGSRGACGAAPAAAAVTKPEYNSVDASLWFIIAVDALMRSAAARGEPLPSAERAQLTAACEAILSGYAAGTRYRIGLDQDGLLAAGEPGVQLTWMDAKVGDWVVTPRRGKPVEIQALWLNALAIAGAWSKRWSALYERGLASFGARFWDEASGTLYDVVDVDHVPGRVDPALRPNQLFAVGGLPVCLLEPARARRVIDAVEAQLLTPLGLRSLAPSDRDYVAHYQGGVRERDGAYHQGTVWPWLIGPFVEAWVRVRGNTRSARLQARARFLAPLRAYIEREGLGHLCEIADAQAPHAPRGCPFQAWSLGEVMRLEFDVLAETPITARDRAG